MALFGWITLFTEAALAALLLSARYLRIAALFGVAQSLAIGLTVANAPDEWYWAYLLMIGLHLAVLRLAPTLRPTSPRTMAIMVGAYGVLVAISHLGAGFTGGGHDRWTLFTGSRDIPDEFGQGTFAGSVALGLVFIIVAATIWALTDSNQQVRVITCYVTVAASILLMLSYRRDGLAFDLGSRATTATVLAAAGLALTGRTAWLPSPKAMALEIAGGLQSGVHRVS